MQRWSREHRDGYDSCFDKCPLWFRVDFIPQAQVMDYNFPNGRRCHHVMLCFSHVWPDLQRCGERESKMDFKEETTEMLRGARTCPVLLVEENLEPGTSSPGNIWLRFVFGCLYTWLWRHASKNSGKLWGTRKPPTEMVVESSCANLIM